MKPVPEPERLSYCRYVAPLRLRRSCRTGLAVELVVVLAIYKAVFKGGSVAEAASRAPADMPPWVAKLLAIEANFWLNQCGASSSESLLANGRKRCLTPRSSGAPTAGHQARSGGTRYIFASPGLASCRCRPLSSNVRRRNPLPQFPAVDNTYPSLIIGV